VDLFEYQGKQLFARYGIPVSAGEPVDTVDDAIAAAERVGYPVVVKAQVQVGGRGKAGGIKLANDTDEVREHAGNILGMDIRGHVVRRLWIEHASDIAEEYYASFTLDRSAKQHLGMLSAEGGVEIEKVADDNPDAISRIHVDPVEGLTRDAARAWVEGAKLNPDVTDDAVDVLLKLYEAYEKGDCDLVEINPLIVTTEGRVHALDAKVTLDDNAAYRHPHHADLLDLAAEDPQEAMARERGLTYVKLDGDIGILGNGAGLVMSTLDVVAQAGGAPANFLDAGGGSKAEAITSAVEVILSNPNVKAVLFNIFGGITRCDEVARGLIEAFDQIQPDVPFVVRLDGTNDKEGRRLLAEADLPNVHPEATMLGAAERVVELAAAGAAA